MDSAVMGTGTFMPSVLSAHYFELVHNMSHEPFLILTDLNTYIENLCTFRTNVPY